MSLAVAAATGVSACATLKKVVATSQDPLLNQIVDEMPLSTDIQQRIATYRKYAGKFQRFHDSGVLDDSDVLDVLRDTGVISHDPKTGKPRPGAKPTRPPVQAYKGGYRWPTDAGVISSEYGARWGKQHKGVDVAADIGEPVKASANGVVIYSGSGLRGYGNVIILRHDDKTTTLYAHNSKLIAKDGQKVGGGQVIALLGNSGRSTGPHVHFEIREGDMAINPRTRLGSPPYALRFEERHLAAHDHDH